MASSRGQASTGGYIKTTRASEFTQAEVAELAAVLEAEFIVFTDRGRCLVHQRAVSQGHHVAADARVQSG